mgnify:CR=1 FL=1
MKPTLENHVAFITGGGSGLGAAAARRLAADGALIAINDLDLAAAERVASEVGGMRVHKWRTATLSGFEFELNSNFICPGNGHPY